MTTILALARDGQVWMAADSFTTVYDRPMPGSARKIRRIGHGRREALIGIAGDGALAAMVDSTDVTLPAGNPIKDPGTWANDLARNITQAAVDRRLTTSDGRLDGRLLLGVAGTLWTVLHMQAIPHGPGLAAVGSGSDAAIGAARAFIDYADGDSPNAREATVRRAVRIGIGFDVNSGGPIQTEYLGVYEPYVPGRLVVDEAALRAACTTPGEDAEPGSRYAPGVPGPLPAPSTAGGS